jgi:hypothetical protein
MATYPGPKVHRVSRRHLGRGQSPSAPPVTVTMTDAADTATMTFNVNVVVSGPIPLAVSGGVTATLQTVVSPKIVTILFSGPLTMLTWSLPANAANVASFQGGRVAGASGTFT